MRLVLNLVLALGVAGCAAHLPTPGALGATKQVAFIARIEDDAGPRSTVFRGDASYREKLKRLSDDEADRRLGNALAAGSFNKQGELDAPTITRFEFADSMRASTLALLPKVAPWTRVTHPVQVARVLESFLVQEVPANAPDYERLRSLGADSVVEIVIESYGMRSENGVAGVYVLGFARMFRIGGGELYRRAFFSDDLKAGLPHLDPFEARRDAQRFAQRIKQVVAGISAQVAKDLTVAPTASEGPKAGDGPEPEPGPIVEHPDDPL